MQSALPKKVSLIFNCLIMGIVVDNMQSLDSIHFQKLQEIVSLVAYVNPFISPLSHYLNESRKGETAEKLHKYILGISKINFENDY